MGLRCLRESHVAADAIVQFRAWWEEARATGDVWSDAMVLATSSPEGGPDVLERRLRELAAAHEGRPVGRPPGWGGYLVAPDVVEFWQGRPDHLHDRLRYRRGGAGWRIERLAP
jgi:pyridoxine/pyridoxamine 5'-phosphate oxidase